MLQRFKSWVIGWAKTIRSRFKSWVDSCWYAIEKALYTTFRRGGFVKVSAVASASFIASLLGIATGLRVVFFTNENNQIYWIYILVLFIVTGTIIWSFIHQVQHQRDGRYVKIAEHMHDYTHHIRDLHTIYYANRHLIHAASPKLSDLIKIKSSCETELGHITQIIKKTFDDVTGFNTAFCIKYIYPDSREFIRAKTLTRDRRSAQDRSHIDQRNEETGNDAVYLNKHFKLVSSVKPPWTKLYNCKREMNPKHFKAQQAYNDSDSVRPFESLVLAAVCFNKFKGNVVKNNQDTSDRNAVKPRTIGIIHVDCDKKYAFCRNDEKLLEGFADGLFWAVHLYNYLGRKVETLEEKPKHDD